MSDKDTQDLYENDSMDLSAGGALGAAVRNLIAKGKATGYISMEELNKALPEGKLSSDRIEDIMSAISEMGIDIVSNEEDYEPEDEPQEDDVQNSNTIRTTDIALDKENCGRNNAEKCKNPHTLELLHYP